MASLFQSPAIVKPQRSAFLVPAGSRRTFQVKASRSPDGIPSRPKLKQALDFLQAMYSENEGILHLCRRNKRYLDKVEEEKKSDMRGPFLIDWELNKGANTLSEEIIRDESFMQKFEQLGEDVLVELRRLSEELYGKFL